MSRCDTDELLTQIGIGSGVALLSLVSGTILGLSFSYVVLLLSSPVLYGFVAILSRAAPILLGLFKGMDAAINRTIPRLSVDGQNAVITTVFGITAIVCCVTIVGVFVGTDMLIDVTMLEPHHDVAILVFLMGIPALSVMYLLGAIFRSYKQIRLANIVSTVGIPVAKIVGVSFGLLFVSKTLFGAWVGISTMLVLTALTALYLLLRFSSFSFTSPLVAVEDVREFLSYAMFSTASSLAAIVQYQGTFILMMVLLPPTDAGLYSLGISIAGILGLPLWAVNQIFPPIMSELYNQNAMDELEQLYEQTTRLLMFVIFPATVFLLVYSRQILAFFSEVYVYGQIAVVILVIGYFVATVIGSVGLLLAMTDHQKELVWLMVGIDVIFMPFVVFLAYNYGLVGLAIGCAGILIVNNSLELALLVWKTGMFPFTWGHVQIFVLGCVFLGSSWVTTQISWYVGIVSFAIFTLAYSYVVYVHLLQHEDRRIMSAIVRSI